MKSLYICYFSLREPLVETQVLAYLRQLASAGHQIWFMTFEPGWPKSWKPEEVEAKRQSLAGQGITWIALKYHKKPSLLATMWDIAVGALTARRLAKQVQLDVIHGRAHVASAMGALARWRRPQKLIFDIRGFNPEEYVDAGRWKPNSLKFRSMKAAEKAVLRVAHGFVILTDAGRQLMFPDAKPLGETGAWALPDGRPIEVIPCCVDIRRFDEAALIPRHQAKQNLGLEGRRIVAYVGALGGWYMTGEMVRTWILSKKHDPTSFALIYTQSPRDEIVEPLTCAGMVENTDFLVKKVTPSDLPKFLRAADVALSFIKPSYSKISSSPTKLAEYLAAGCVVISTRKIGDCDQQLNENKVGVLLDDTTDTSLEQGLKTAFELAAEPDIENRCFETVKKLFDLQEIGGLRYKRLYQRLFTKAN